MGHCGNGWMFHSLDGGRIEAECDRCGYRTTSLGDMLAHDRHESLPPGERIECEVLEPMLPPGIEEMLLQKLSQANAEIKTLELQRDRLRVRVAELEECVELDNQDTLRARVAHRWRPFAEIGIAWWLDDSQSLPFWVREEKRFPQKEWTVLLTREQAQEYLDRIDEYRELEVMGPMLPVEAIDKTKVTQ